LYNNGQYDEAVNHFQQSILLGNGTHISPVFNLALTYANLGQTDNALDQLRNGLGFAQLGDIRNMCFELYYQLREGTFSRQLSLSDSLAGL
jgi:tetratricopeptide (TPR) repeat protein